MTGGPAASTGRAEERFRREIALAAQFDHLSLTRILGSGTTVDGRLFAVLEWIEGEPVDQHVRARTLGLDARILLALQVARGVPQLHERGCIHRDLKPANILVSPAGEPKILDFGLARALDPTEFGPTLSIEGEVLGTPHFMAPEQAEGESSRVAPPSDVWALGILLFFLATEKWPHAPRTPRDLEAIILKCLSRDPSGRYATAGGRADDLERYLAREPVSARPATLLYILGRTLRRHRAAAALAVGVLAAGAGAAGWHSYAQTATNRHLQAALDEAMNLRSFLLLDLRWDFERSGREDILTGVARRAQDFPAQAAARGMPPGPRFDPRRFEALAANLRGQAAAFRENLAGALSEFEHEHTLNRQLLEAYPADPLVALDAVSSAANASVLQLRLEGPSAAVLLLYAESRLEEARIARRGGQWAHALNVLHDARPRLEDPAVTPASRFAALGTNYGEAALAHMGLGRFEEAKRELELAEQQLIAMRKLGYFEPSMWRERVTARIAHRVAERLLDSGQADAASTCCAPASLARRRPAQSTPRGPHPKGRSPACPRRGNSRSGGCPSTSHPGPARGNRKKPGASAGGVPQPATVNRAGLGSSSPRLTGRPASR